MKLKRILLDPLVYILLIINIGLGYAYFKKIVTSETLLFTYFFQSVVMGISYYIQMLMLSDYSVKDVTFNNKPLEKSRKTKGCFSTFFLFWKHVHRNHAYGHFDSRL